MTASNAAGKGTATRAQATDRAVRHRHLQQRRRTATSGTYCDADVDGRNGNEIFTVTRQDNDQAGRLGQAAAPGCKAYCKKQRRERRRLDLQQPASSSTWWVQVELQRASNYIPWAWLNLDGGDDINVLPTC